MFLNQQIKQLINIIIIIIIIIIIYVCFLLQTFYRIHKARTMKQSTYLLIELFVVRESPVRTERM